jgi:hypothetical protein
MRRRMVPAIGFMAMVLSVACGGSSSDDDTGTGPDGGGGKDTGTIDAGADAGIDSGADAGIDSGADSGIDSGLRVFGVTVDDPWVADSPGCALNGRLDGLVAAGGRKPTARVVFDEGIDQVFSSGGLDASEYVGLVQNIAPHATVMGELLDSLFVGDYTLDQYRARACEYRATLGHLVDVWEIGNEVNGEWLGSDVVDKLAAAAGVFSADAGAFATLCPGFSLQPAEKPFGIALTLYYNGPWDGGVPTAGNCWSDADHAMERWVDDNFAAAGATGTTQVAPHLDWVLVSFYEDGCEGIQPAWQAIFDHLGEVFGGAKLGFGECGTETAASKVAYVERYYHGMDLPDAKYANMHVDHPRYVGGFFWWFFSEDMDDADVYGELAGALDNPFWE